MRPSFHFIFTTAAIAANLCLTSALSRAGHVYAGLLDTNGTSGLQNGDALSFVNNLTGVAVTGAEQGVQPMTVLPSGLYFTNNISFTALSNGRNWTGADYRAANTSAPTAGSLIQLRIASATGPSGAAFSFWDDAVSTTGPAITFTIGTGVTLGSGIFNLTDLSLIVGDGLNNGVGEPPSATNNPPVDPYGHLHGRSMTVNTPGEYTVSYILHDASGQHPDSAPFVVSYSAVPEPGAVAMLAGGAALFAAIIRRRKKVER